MDVIISRALADAIRADARKSAPNECCGLLLGAAGSGVVDALLPTINVAAAALHRFEIDPAALLIAHKAARAGGRAILGHYHSHPVSAPVPSQTDATMAQASGELWLIVGKAGTLRAWRAQSGGALHGVFDEVALTEAPDGVV